MTSMDRERLLLEAQLIGQNFSFWATSESYEHLFGYVYETENTKYQVDVKFDHDFPLSPPRLFFAPEVLELIGGDIRLRTLENWTPDSHVVDVLLELRYAIQQVLTGPATAIGESEGTGVSGGGQSSTSGAGPAATPGEGEFVTPDLTLYPAEGVDGVQPWDETWEAGESEREDAGDATVGGGVPLDQATGPGNSSSTAAGEDAVLNPLVANQVAEIQQWFAVDEVRPGIVQVFITIPTGQTYLVEVDLHDYPSRPVLKLPAGISDVIGEPYINFESLKDWTEKSPGSVLSVLQELETKMFGLQDLETEVRMVQGEFDSVIVPGSIGLLKVNILTLGFKRFTLQVDVTPYPKRPVVEFSPELSEFLTESINEVDAYTGWKVGESHVVDVLREIQWLVEKNSRLDLELQLLKGSLKDVQMSGNVVSVKMKGQMKTKDLTFEFQVALPSDYPTSAPRIKLLSDLEGQEDVAKKIEASMKEFQTSWSTFSYLIDLFNKISQAIFEVSILKCILCHKLECPSCAKPIAASTPSEESCHTACPHCERAYHKHCWEQTIASFHKCGFCMRPPPPGFNPDDPLPGGPNTVTEF
ncbi:MAG: hypothetical protein Kow0069_04780 [Promethearchaeota archaeon]